MYFLIEYDPPRGELVSLRTFPESEWKAAASARLDLELDLHHKGLDREVVILDGPSQEALLKTHGRYFQSLEESFEALVTAIGAH